MTSIKIRYCPSTVSAVCAVTGMAVSFSTMWLNAPSSDHAAIVGMWAVLVSIAVALSTSTRKKRCQ